MSLNSNSVIKLVRVSFTAPIYLRKSTRLNSSHQAISYAVFWSTDVCSLDRKSTRLNSSHQAISYALFCFEDRRAGVTSDQSVRRRVIAHVGRRARAHP